MNLSLRNIKTMASLSEETHCYSAALYLDGKKIADVSNHGHGGCDDQRFVSREIEASVNDYFKSLPSETITLGGFTYESEPSLEIWCCDRVNDFLLLKAAKRVQSKKVHAISGGKEYTFKMDPALLDIPTPYGSRRASLVAKFPGIVILNGMADDALLAALRSVGV